jgi:DNA-binding GntR family transcriptional regulator
MAPGTTRTADVYQVLRAEILNGVFEPGQRLKLVALGKRFGVSLSVVREALTRLAEQGLLVLNPQRGFSVVPLSVDDLSDLTCVRIHIECLALREAVQRGDVPWEAQIVSSHYAMERTPMQNEDGTPNEQWSDCHRTFHQALLAACGSPRLQSIADALRESADLYRTWSGSLAGDRSRDPAAEHRRLKDLCLARDADGAAQSLAEHIERASLMLLKWVGERDGLTAFDAAALAASRVQAVAAAQGRGTGSTVPSSDGSPGSSAPKAVQARRTRKSARKNDRSQG